MLFFQDVEVSPEQRDEIVSWMITLNRRFSFYPETLMLSVAILDKFLHSVKVCGQLYTFIYLVTRHSLGLFMRMSESKVVCDSMSKHELEMTSSAHTSSLLKTIVSS